MINIVILIVLLLRIPGKQYMNTPDQDPADQNLSPPPNSCRQASLRYIIRDFRDVVFEYVVFDTNRFDIDVTITNNV